MSINNRLMLCVPLLSLFLAVGSVHAAPEIDDVTADILDVWESESWGRDNVNNDGSCVDFGAAVEAGTSATLIGDVAYVSDGGDHACRFVLGYTGASGERTLFSPSANSRAEPRHYWVDAADVHPFEVRFRSTGKSSDAIRLFEVFPQDVIAGSGMQCYTPSGEVFDGPSPCNPDLGHGRHGDEPKEPGPPASVGTEDHPRSNGRGNERSGGKGRGGAD